jgi:hypothetical protein
MKDICCRAKRFDCARRQPNNFTIDGIRQKVAGTLLCKPSTSQDLSQDTQHDIHQRFRCQSTASCCSRPSPTHPNSIPLYTWTDLALSAAAGSL